MMWNDVRYLPTEQLEAAFEAENAKDLFIGGFVNEYHVYLIRGNHSSIEVPREWFTKPLGGCCGVNEVNTPDFMNLSFTDYGNNVKLGKYEVASDAILWDFDPDAKLRMQENEASDALGEQYNKETK